MALKQIEAEFRCPSCKGIPYRVMRVLIEGSQGVYRHETEALDGAPQPNAATLKCPRCEIILERV